MSSRSPGPDERRLVELLHAAVDDVEPGPAGLARIRARIARRRPRAAHWAAVVVGAALATAAVVVVVSMVSTRGERSTAGPGLGHGHATGSQVVRPSDGMPPSIVPVYYLGATGHGYRLYRELHPARPYRDPGAEAAVAAVGSPPADPDYLDPWPTSTSAFSVRVTGRRIVVDLTSDSADLRRRPAGMSDQEAAAALQQLVYTVQDALHGSRLPVRVLVDGRHPTTLLGVPLPAALARAPASATLAQVVVTSPVEGARVHRHFRVSGRAATFEGTVLWELRRDGHVVRHGVTTAEQCCTLAPYSFAVSAPPGRYTLRVHDTDPSGGAGVPPWQDTKQLTVVP